VAFIHTKQIAHYRIALEPGKNVEFIRFDNFVKEILDEFAIVNTRLEILETATIKYPCCSGVSTLLL